MDLRIEIELKENLLVARLDGELKFDAALRVLRQTCDTAAEERINRVFINSLGLEGELAGYERYRLGVVMAAYLTERRIRLRVAFAGVPPAMNGFGALVAQNRGVDTKVFPTVEEALSWLAEVPDEPFPAEAAAPVQSV